MTYEIRTYSEEYLEKQFEIGNSILTDWPGTGQTQVDNLRTIYSREEFDPETKFYAFKDGEMVGFQTARIKPLKEDEIVVRANMEFPLVLPDHEEAVHLLMEYAMAKLREKGVGRVQSRASQTWGRTMEYVDKYNYALKRQLAVTGTVQVPSDDVEEIGEVREYNQETDYEIVREMYLTKMKLPEQQLDNQFKFLKENPDAVASWNVYVKDGEVLGNSIVTYLGGDKEKGIMANIFATGDQEKEIRRKIFRANLLSLQQKGIDELTVLLANNTIENRDQYEELGVNFNPPLNLYHRDI